MTDEEYRDNMSVCIPTPERVQTAKVLQGRVFHRWSCKNLVMPFEPPILTFVIRIPQLEQCPVSCIIWLRTQKFKGVRVQRFWPQWVVVTRIWLTFVK